jgi:hypothetical protein
VSPSADDAVEGIQPLARFGRIAINQHFGRFDRNAPATAARRNADLASGAELQFGRRPK